ncbi:MAG: hypothetical protein QOJ64_120 [Acidobacteriota bacterium]|jgi:hypothetical protein|nr:hypothetical protein [Acidobacteriota bacterium]
MNTVIYYPYIHPPLEWLRLSALCWDKVYRMTTWDAPSDPDEIRELDEVLGGILEPIDVSEIAKDKQVESSFVRWVRDRQKRLRAEPLSNGMSAAIDVHISKMLGPGGSNYLGFLYNLNLIRDLRLVEGHSISQRLRSLFKSARDSKRESDAELIAWLDSKDEERRRELKFAPAETASERDEALRGQVVSVDRDIGLHFLSLCASKAAKDGNRDLAADGEVFTDTVFYDYRALRGEVASSVLQAYLPSNVCSLEPIRIAEFRADSGPQRLKYQKEIQAVCREFSEVSSEGELAKIKDRIVSLAQERVEDTKQIYRRAKLDIVVKSIGISVTPPALATYIASALGVGIFAPAGIVAALSIFIATRLIEWDKAKLEKKSSAWSYVLDSAKIV